ncbi:MAG TPA: ABC transporter substrate-binding protein [Pseudonocardiaceae bacterium]|nr:ABC transporter substrate-binding protein [Pseudonocardiaceae bacterium]
MVKSLRTRVGFGVLATALLASTAGCGTRASDRSIVDALRAPITVAATTGSAPVDSGDTTTAAAPGAPVAAGGTVSAPAAGAAAAAAGAAAAPTKKSPAAQGSAPRVSAASAGTHAASAKPGSSGDEPKAPASPTVADKSPVTVGTLGPFSGVLGAVTAGSPRTISAWAAYANSHGGLNGHPIKVVVADDQADPGTSLTLARRLVENDHAIAFVGDIQFFGFQQVEQYLRSKNVPMIGGDGVDAGWQKSPITFPVAPPVATQIIKGLKMYVDSGARKIAMLYCLEVGSLCQYLNDQAKKSEVGQYIEQSYQVSLVAPSYTSQCLRMKQANLEVVYMLLDTASASRVTKDCATQGYKPKFMLLGLDATREMPTIPSLSDALIPGATASPGAANLAAVTEYRQVMQTFAPSVGDSGFGLLGWAAAKLLGLAGKNLSDSPTSADLFTGLYTVKDESFGGFTVPLTFTEQQRAAKPCVFIWGVAADKFAAPQGNKPLC